MILSADGAVVSVNDALAAMTGFLPSELTTASPPCWTDETRAALLAASDQGHPGSLDVAFVDHRGARLPVTVRFLSVADDAGRRVAVVRPTSDAQALARDAERWRSICESPMALVVVVDRAFRFVYVNHMADGIDAKDFIGKATPFDFIAPEHHAQVRSAFERSVAERVTTSYEVRVPELDRWFASVVAPVIEDGDVTGLTILTHDITDRQLAVDALRQSEERLQLVIEAADVGAFAADMASGDCFLSPQLYELLGFDGGDAGLGTRVAELRERLHPEDAARIERALARAVEDGARVDAECRVRTKSGQYRWFRGRGRRASAPGGPERFAGFVTDVTASKARAEEEARSLSVRRTAQRMEELGGLASGIAHDFNNLLVPILGNLELVHRSLPGDGPLARQIEESMRAARRAQDTIKRILSFARPTEDARVSVDLAPLLEEVVRLARAAAGPRVTLRTLVSEGACRVEGDPTQLHQMLTNLVTNAMHACREQGGSIEVSLRLFEIDTAFAERHRVAPGPAVRLAVTDTGVGMSADVLERVRAPFFTTRPVGEGTGLGVAIVDAVVRRHGGVLSIESKEGSGTTVSVVLPCQTGDRAKSAPPRAQAGAIGRALRVLCVDDEAPVLRVLVSLLEAEGHACTALRAPYDALAAVRATPDAFDLVISDLTMPRMKGHELAREIEGVRADLPVIIVTGWGPDPALRADAAKSVKAWLEKPFSRESLINAMAQAVQTREKK
jgi:PAS domain S-box-containing protein